MQIATGDGAVPVVTDEAATALLEQWRFTPQQAAFLEEAVAKVDAIRAGTVATAEAIPSAFATPAREHNPADPNCSCGHCPAQAEEAATPAAAAVCWHDLIATAAV